MLNRLTIDNMVFRGPAYNSGQLCQNDVIVQIDGVPGALCAERQAQRGEEEMAGAEGAPE